MKTDKPTPIPRRASARKKAPEPIEFPTPKMTSHTTNDLEIVHPKPSIPLTEEEIKIFVSQCVHEALREHDRLLIHTFYKVVMDWPLAEIITMGEAEFEARCRSILEDEE